jgi:hypothetical protein
MRIEPGPQFQQVVDAEGRPARRGSGERVRRHEIGQVGGQGQQVALGIAIEDPVLTPVLPTGDQRVLGTAERVEGMDDPEPDRSIVGMTCN